MAILANPRPIFQPAMRIISNITNAFPASVTTTFKHQYNTGMIIRLNIPLGYGMQEANQLYGPIVVTGNTTFTIDIDTTNFSVYSTPSTFPNNQQFAQTTPMAEINSTILYATRNILPFTS